MQNDQSAKQLVVERVKKATNILVTVSRNPSVDELSAALGLTLMLNKLDKHATAVFSGQVPSALEFLKPEKTFEDTVDSLRDFIIALDKEKADRLRYKVEDDVVRIFITPYRTVINEKDLNFSQGDFNVELIIALGVDTRDDLDSAISAHGRILHDATVVTINDNNDKNTLGGIDWSDEKASSLCEMLMSLSEALQSGILDEQISTALLTGIVAATDRFRNEHTSPKVMTMAAQLMAAGANQQLIAAKLEEGHELNQPDQSNAPAPDGSTKLKEGETEKLNRKSSSVKTPNKERDDGSVGEMQIEHPSAAKTPPVETKEDEPAPADNEVAPPATEATQDAPQPAKTPEVEAAERDLADSFNNPPTQPTLSVDDLKKDIESATRELSVAAEKPLNDKRPAPLPASEPTFNATFNATTDAAAEEKRNYEQQNRSHALLSHDATDSSVMESSRGQAAINSVSASSEETPPTVDPLTGPSLEDLEKQAHSLASPETTQQDSLNDARAAVDAALESQFDPAHNPAQSAGAQPFGYIETPVQGAPEPTPSQPVALPTTEGLPPLPDFSTLPPLPGTESGPDSTQTPLPGEPAQPEQPPQEPSNDPTQFKLPGQP